MQKTSQIKVNNNSTKRKLSARMSNYRSVFIGMVYRTGLSMEEVADIFGTTKQNVSSILKKNKKYENRKP